MRRHDEPTSVEASLRASWWQLVVANLVDGLLLIVAFVGLLLFWGALRAGVAWLGLLCVVFGLGANASQVVGLVRWGRTPGMFVAGIRLIGVDDADPRLGLSRAVAFVMGRRRVANAGMLVVNEGAWRGRAGPAAHTGGRP